MVDLGACVEPLSPQVVVPRRARPAAALRRRRRLDAQRSCSARAEAAPACRRRPRPRRRASELCRLFAHGRVESALAGAAVPDRSPTTGRASVTHAYAAMKLLAQRAGLRRQRAAARRRRRSRRAPSASPTQLASCADDFLGARAARLGAGSTRRAIPATPPRRRPAPPASPRARATHAATRQRSARPQSAEPAVAWDAFN